MFECKMRHFVEAKLMSLLLQYRLINSYRNNEFSILKVQ